MDPEILTLPSKPYLCFPCGVRMSSMFQAAPPPPPKTVLTAEAVRSLPPLVPLVLSHVHEVYDIVYETSTSFVRAATSSLQPSCIASSSSCAPSAVGVQQQEQVETPFALLDPRLYPVLHPVKGAPQWSWPPSSCAATTASVAEVVVEDEAGTTVFPAPIPRPSSTSCAVGSATHLCAACNGLYQFMDHLYAPTIAAAVRLSPYQDSTEVSVNINASRAISFGWLSCAVLYKAKRRDEEVVTVADADVSTDSSSLQIHRSSLPEGTKLVPEEFGSFKEFFIGDLRARILQYLRVPHDTLMNQSSNSHLEGLPLYLHITKDAMALRCAQPSHQFGVTQGSAKVALPLVAQAFNYAPQGCGVVVEVDCTIPLLEPLLSPSPGDTTKPSKLKRRRMEEGGDEDECGIVPYSYCTNKNWSLPYSVLYDYVFPYFQKEQLVLWARRQEKDNSLTTATTTTARINANVSHANVFLIGSYRKMLRSLSQSPWFCEGGRIGSYSLQEEIATPLLEAFFPYGLPTPVVPSNTAKRLARAEEYAEAQEREHHAAAAAAASSETQPQDQAAGQLPRRCQGRLPTGMASPWQSVDPFQTALANVVGYGHYKFHSAGREDVDVRMLGSGRPFVLELVSPHRETLTAEQLRAIEAAVNDSDGVEIDQLRYTTQDITVDLARHSESKTKTYRCVVWCSRAIVSDADPLLVAANATKDLVVSQRTPLRVLHRRSLLDRPKVIHSIRCERVNSHWLMVELETQAGTYVKEFVHGDLGRTVPSLGVLLGGRCDIIQLDVCGMVMPAL